ncbi:PLP-dependent aminotransferase family protein [Agromyces intestinalis]|uniref:PLP-dependent aminotransferase family protein n=1 Tax=Agromyces intestinalis TaxID=2592652 RepID=A0A5C1YDM6_9MICO|nr:PLP-dependent aminotransferase family protein [Agromyces intestinalis]QEO13097.1 PLP-dependent aminotransferase family protein [Agromyces intestinalis]
MSSDQANLGNTALAWEVLLDLDAEAGRLRDRMERALRAAIGDGRLAPGSVLPPSRLLAARLGISRWVVTEAYGQLVAEGVLEARVGAGTRVPPPKASPLAQALPPQSGRGDRRADVGGGAVDMATSRPAPARFDLGAGKPDLRFAPRDRWIAAMRRALAVLPDAELTESPRNGNPRARAAVAAHLVASRNALTGPAEVVVTASTRDAVDRVAAALRTLGHTHLLVEDPSWSALRTIAAQHGLAPVPVPVDDDGVDVDALVDTAHRTGARVALVTPAHQFPLGAALSPGRREALARWAREQDAVLIEDDYDAEFRYDRRPIAALQRHAPERTVLLGSLSKSVSPAFGIGWAVVPEWLQAALPPTSSRPSTLDQLAFAEFVEGGDFARHLRASRIRLGRRRATLAAAVARELPGARLTGIEAGMHAVLALPSGMTAASVVTAAAAAGVEVSDAAWYRASETPRPEALVLSYGNLADPLVDEAVAELARIIQGLVPRR